MGAEYLWELADTVLDAALDAISEDRTGRPPPERVYVSHGPPDAQGCPNGQLTVHIEPIQMRVRLAARRQAIRQSAVPTAPFVVRLYRCVTPLNEDGSVPSAQMEDDTTREMMADGWALATGLWAAPSFVNCHGVELGTVQPLRQQGGYAGWQVTLTIGLSDSGPD